MNNDLLEKIGDWIKNNTSPEIYWDYRDEVSPETIATAMETHPEHPLTYIYENCIDDDNVYDLELGAIAEGIEHFKVEVMADLGIEEDDFDAKELARENRDELVEYTSVDYNIGDLLKGTINVRVELMSNYDCINSHWFESQSPIGYEETYFGDTVKALRLNPQDVKRMLIEKGLEVYGKWPKKDGSKALVKLEDFWQEMENRGCPACLLAFVGKVDIEDLLGNDSKKTLITIPKGNYMGFYSSSQGGGSMIEAPLQHDVKLDLNKNYDGHGMGYRMVLDVSGNGYTIDSSYGVTKEFWGKEILLSEKRITKSKIEI